MGRSGFLARDTVGILNWSPCGTEEILRINTSLEIESLLEDRTGRISLSSIDIEQKGAWSFTFLSRRCS